VLKAFKILFICGVFTLLFILPRNLFLWNNEKNKSSLPKTQAVHLTAKEQAWLKTHQPIRIAFDGYFPPYSFVNGSGEISGISYDTIQLISKKLNIQIEIDDRVNWKDIYQAVLDKKVDVIATMVKRQEREEQFSFTQPYIFKSLVIITHKTNEQIKDRSDLSGKTVALVKDYQYSEGIIKDFPDITPFYVETMEDALFAVETEQAETAISFFSTSYFIQNKFLLSNIKFAAYYNRNSANERIAVRNDWPVLTTILQKGLNSITLAEKHAINAKWYPPIEMPIDYETISKIIVSFLFILLILLLWISQIKSQNRRIKNTRNRLLTTNTELNNLKENLEKLVFERTKQLKNSEQKYRSLVENLEDEYFFFQYDSQVEFTYISPSISTILGYSVNNFIMNYSSYLTDHPNNEKIIGYTSQCLNGEKVPAYEIEILDSKGHKRSLEILENSVYNDIGDCIGIEGIAHDITLLKQTRDRLNWLSYYDDLTGLANRRLFKERVEHSISLSHRLKDQMALLFLDLDRFKIVNDSLGHAAGDEVLKETASRLQIELRNSDVAARIGGDEFTLILPATNAEAAEIVAKKILHSLLTPYVLNDQQFVLGTSIGIAIYPQDGNNAETLLQQADAAMYMAKKTKKGYAFCTSELHQTSNRRLQLEQALRKALEQNCYDDAFELNVVFQPKYCIKDNNIQGYEALMRWQHPDFGTVSPIEFIPLAEEAGLIIELSRWVITKVCKQAVRWSTEKIYFGKIAVNISAVELINFELAKNIIEQIDLTGAMREWIEVEITESALMKTPDVAIKVMQELVNAGVLIAIDDFGTGYSSLSYLKNLPASYIKIDQSFICNLLNSPEDQAVVQAVVAMSHALGKKVIAEGVETQEQLDFLTKNNCDIAQGYFFSKPITAKSFVKPSTPLTLV
jgi:diguanylate cyclase (GGDEF)-like protein/PAS domain S-box-containing protein